MALSWAAKRKMIYGGSFLLIVVLFVVASYFTFFYKVPVCTDGIQNGDETGVDCGGSCPILCSNQTIAPIVYWSKAFNVTTGVYNVAAYIENPNITSSNPHATYEFRLFDENNILITTRDGSVSIPRNQKFVVFEPSLVIQNKKPKRVEFVFTGFDPWQKDTHIDPDLSIFYSPLTGTTTAPHINGTLTNKTLQSVGKVELVAMISDKQQNTIAVSRTVIDSLPQKSSADFVFTWPKPFVEGGKLCAENPVGTDTGSQSTTTFNYFNATSSASVESTTTDVTELAPCSESANVVTILYRILP